MNYEFIDYYTKYKDSIRTYLYKKAGNNFTCHVDDMFQDTIFISMTRFHQLKEKEKFLFWVYRIADSIFYKYTRMESKRCLYGDMEEVSDYIYSDSSKRYLFDDQYITKIEDREFFKKLLSRIDSDSLKIFYLYYYHKIPVKIIAKHMNLKIRSVQYIIDKTKKALFSHVKNNKL